MARLKTGNGQGYSGKVGGVVYVQSNGQDIIRTVQVRRKNSWTESQKLHRQRFKAINEYCRRYKYLLIPQIWNLAAENGHGYNLFLQANSSAFALDGQLAEIEKLHFSAGKIPLPRQLKAKRPESDPSKVEVSWSNDENLSRVYAHDELMLVGAYADHFTDRIATGVLRENGLALIDLPEGSENLKGIWLFFRACKKDGYSGDAYFGID